MYVSRDKDGNIKGYTRWPSSESAEKVEEDSAEFVEFVEKIRVKAFDPLTQDEIKWLKTFIAAEKAKRT